MSAANSYRTWNPPKRTRGFSCLFSTLSRSPKSQRELALGLVNSVCVENNRCDFFEDDPRKRVRGSSSSTDKKRLRFGREEAKYHPGVIYVPGRSIRPCLTADGCFEYISNGIASRRKLLKRTGPARSFCGWYIEEICRSRDSAGGWGNCESYTEPDALDDLRAAVESKDPHKVTVAWNAMAVSHIRFERCKVLPAIRGGNIDMGWPTG